MHPVNFTWEFIVEIGTDLPRNLYFDLTFILSNNSLLINDVEGPVSSKLNISSLPNLAVIVGMKESSIFTFAINSLVSLFSFVVLLESRETLFRASSSSFISLNFYIFFF